MGSLKMRCSSSLAFYPLHPNDLEIEIVEVFETDMSCAEIQSLSAQGFLGELFIALIS